MASEHHLYLPLRIARLRRCAHYGDTLRGLLALRAIVACPALADLGIERAAAERDARIALDGLRLAIVVAARGIRCDSVVVITGGTTTIATSGDCLYDQDANEYSSAACIKCDYDFTMSGGTLTMTSSGDGGKGINSSAGVVFSGGTLSAITTGDNDEGKPKAVKADKGITVSGGSFYAKVNKSWACDSGYGDDNTSDDEKLANCVTVVGSPATKNITKKQVQIIFE